MTPILYLHGFASGPMSSKARHLRDRFARAGVHIEVPDLAGGDFEHLTISSQLAIVERCANGRAVCLVGSSLGGYLSALYAARHPEVVRLVLLAPAFGFAQLWAETLGPERVEAWRRARTMEVYHYGAGAMRKLDYGLLADAAKYEAYPDFRKPALILHGRGDTVVPVSGSEQFAAAHPNVRLEILEAGHDMLNVLDVIAAKTVAFLLDEPTGPVNLAAQQSCR